MNARYPLLLVILFALLGSAVAQDAGSQDNPVQIRLEIFVVSQVRGDDGTTKEQFTSATSARPGQIVEYRLFAKNNGDTTLPPGTVVIIGPVPDGTSFVPNSATPSSDEVLTEFSAESSDLFSKPPVLVGPEGSQKVADPESYSAVRWTLLVPMEPGQEEAFIYRVTVN